MFCGSLGHRQEGAAAGDAGVVGGAGERVRVGCEGGVECK